MVRNVWRMSYPGAMHSDLVRAVTEIREHADHYRLAEDYYLGRVGELFTADSAIFRKIAQSGNAFSVNLARRPVDAVLDRLDITSVSIPGDEGASKILNDAIWNANKLNRGEKLIHRGGLVFGDTYVIVWPGEMDGQVDVFYNSPLTTRVFYDEENPHRKRFAAKVWEADKHTRVTLYYADRIEKYISKTEGKLREVSESDFHEYITDEGEVWPIPNPYGELPVFHFRTDEPYGRPEHADAFGPQNSITKLIAMQMATVDFQGFPQRYVLSKGGTEELIDWDDDETQEPGRESDLESGPGKLWKLTADTIGQFEAADPDNFLKPMSAYVRVMAAATATPLRFFDPQGQIPSGEALRADEAPLAKRINDRQEWFESDWNDTITFAMKVLGIQVREVEITWRPVQAVDDHEGWQTVKLKLDAGVPFDQVMTEAGYTADAVKGWQKIPVQAKAEVLKVTSPERDAQTTEIGGVSRDGR